jgi:hypothetical protein
VNLWEYIPTSSGAAYEQQSEAFYCPDSFEARGDVCVCNTNLKFVMPKVNLDEWQIMRV